MKTEKHKNFNILMVGVGGQGIITSSDILTLAAMYAGYDAKKSEIHGMSQRGGSVFSHVRLGEKIHSPVIAEGEADVLLSLEKMETLRWLPYAHAETQVVVCTTEIKPPMVDEYPSGLVDELKRVCPHLHLIDPGQLGPSLGDAKFLNVALLGYLSVYFDIPQEAWQKAIAEEVPAAYFKQNWDAFIGGKQLNEKSQTTAK